MFLPGRKDLENFGWKIIFTHVVARKTVEFQAIITDFTDQLVSEWGEEKIYGRMDPLLSYNGTSRKINLSWDVVSDSSEEAYENLQKYQQLAQMMYPTWRTTVSSGRRAGGKSSANRLNMDGAPMLRIKFVNLMQESPGLGLLGVINGSLDFRPEMDSGFVADVPGMLAPKAYSLGCSITVLHDHALGHDQSGRWLGVDGFPYGVSPKWIPGLKSTAGGMRELGLNAAAAWLDPQTPGRAKVNKKVAEAKKNRILKGPWR